MMRVLNFRELVPGTEAKELSNTHSSDICQRRKTRHWYSRDTEKGAGVTGFIKEVFAEQVRQPGREGKDQAWLGEEYFFVHEKILPWFPEDSSKGHCGFRQRGNVKWGEVRGVEPGL